MKATHDSELDSRSWTERELMGAAFLHALGYRLPVRQHEGADMVEVLRRRCPRISNRLLRLLISAYVLGSHSEMVTYTLDARCEAHWSALLRAGQLWRNSTMLDDAGNLSTRQVVAEVVNLLLDRSRSRRGEG